MLLCKYCINIRNYNYDQSWHECASQWQQNWIQGCSFWKIYEKEHDELKKLTNDSIANFENVGKILKYTNRSHNPSYN